MVRTREPGLVMRLAVCTPLRTGTWRPRHRGANHDGLPDRADIQEGAQDDRRKFGGCSYIRNGIATGAPISTSRGIHFSLRMPPEHQRCRGAARRHRLYNIDDTADFRRPAHTILLGADIPIVEHLCGLEQLPTDGFRFTAVPVKVKAMALSRCAPMPHSQMMRLVEPHWAAES